MAKISLTVGSLTVERSFGDAAATAVLELVFAGTYRPQEGDPANPSATWRLRYVLDRVVDWLVRAAQEERRRALRAANEAAEKAEAGGISL